MSTYRFSFPTAIHFGGGIRSKVAAHLQGLGFSRPLLVTDRGLASLAICTEFAGLLESADLTSRTFSGIWGNPVKSQVTAGVDAFREHHADCIIGFGGGAALDVAKAIALMVNHPGDLFDYEDDKPGALPVDKEIPYWVALPTTSGTGSEVGRSSVVSDDSTHLKKIIFDPRLLAKAVFADPELTFDLPANITAWTGMDALTHNVEAYLAKGFHPICDGIALEGFRLSAAFLPTATRTPHDLEARSNMMMSSMMGAIAFQKGLGVTHSCAHALGTVADMHHGLANAVMIDFALRHNVHAVGDRMTMLAKVAGLADTTPQGFIGWLGALKATLAIPRNLTEAGVSQDKLDALVAVAIGDACHGSNPTPCTHTDFERIFREAF